MAILYIYIIIMIINRKYKNNVLKMYIVNNKRKEPSEKQKEIQKKRISKNYINYNKKNKKLYFAIFYFQNVIICIRNRYFYMLNKPIFSLYLYHHNQYKLYTTINIIHTIC